MLEKGKRVSCEKNGEFQVQCTVEGAHLKKNNFKVLLQYLM